MKFRTAIPMTLLAASSACGGSQTDPNAVDGAATVVDPAETEVPMDDSEAAVLHHWQDGDADGPLRPLFTLDGHRYLQHADAPRLDHPAFPDDLADRWSEPNTRRARTAAAETDITPLRTATVVTLSGPCQVTLGPLEWVERSECATDAALAQRVSGCEEEHAPVAWVNGTLPADLVWAPVDLVDEWAWLDNDAAVPTLRSNAGFSLLAAYESELLTQLLEAGLRPSSLDSSAVMGWAFGGGELVSIIMAGARTSGDICNDWTSEFMTVGFEVDEGWRSVADDFQLTGVLAQDHGITALVSGLKRRLEVRARGEGYAFTEVFHDDFWFEDAACTEPPTPVSFPPTCEETE